ncbi:hypothetical protein BCR34DRAFT_177895 [Clohesyomyces aquaticus]|uniref:Uncharacterized protein n=1 Tax=Clohesyomyces aquaticus TaxID=1231657 RepID=A0A1Y1ZYU8_9PLEO|nr:hypothetical protein BCR34DRAFT_177895 [Clohesyomyces aquaticus]
MQLYTIIVSLFVFVATAHPFEPRPNTIRVLMVNDQIYTAVRADIPADGSKISIQGAFAGLCARDGNLFANRAEILMGTTGSCRVFNDSDCTSQIGGPLNANGDSVGFTSGKKGSINLVKAFIVCRL